MKERSITRELPSIHYDEEILEDLLGIMADSKEANIDIAIRWGEVKHRYNSIDDLYSAKDIPKNIKNFTITIRENDNRAVIRGADSPNSLHELHVSGSEGWVRKKDDRVSEFAEIHKDSLGDSLKYLIYLQLLLVGIFVALYQRQLNELFISFYSANVGLMYHLRALSLVGLIGFLEGVKRIYPYVILKLGEENLAYKRIIKLLSGIATIIITLGAIANIYGIF